MRLNEGKAEKEFFLVGARGFEPPTSASRTRRADLTALRPDVDCKSSYLDFVILLEAYNLVVEVYF